MDIQTEKLQLIEWLVALKDEALIEQLIKWKEDHQRVTVAQYNKELDEANGRIDAGEFHAHDDIVKESSSWLK